jgi:hypothetical protein
MRKHLLSFIVLLLIVKAAAGQVTEFQGKTVAELFTDFHININDTSKLTGFALNRAYMGYQFMPGGKFSAKFVINAGSPDELSAGTVHHRYVFLREADLIWSDGKLTLTMGLTNTKLYEFQQTFLGKRYVASTFQSINGYGFIADLGVTASYKFNEVLYADLIIVNGEGYNDIQVDNNVRTSAGLTITPTENIAIRLYGDIQKKQGLWQPMAIAFIGFKNDHITVGGEMNYKSNLDLIKGHHAWGISATACYNLSEETQLFTRFDYSTSLVMDGEVLPWNNKRDGKFVVVGVQQTFSPNVRLALDYQGTFPDSSLRSPSNMIFLNALFKF